MQKNICIIDGHPDPSESRFVHALCDEYHRGAHAAGHMVSSIRISTVECEPLKLKDDFETTPSAAIENERHKLAEAEHVVLMFPLWLGSMPAATRAFFEQAARGAFFLDDNDGEAMWPKRMMKGKSARIVITMGMPAFAYKTLFRSASLKAIESGIFGITGFKPIHHTIFGGVDNAKAEKRQQWLAEMRELGVNGK